MGIYLNCNSTNMGKSDWLAKQEGVVELNYKPVFMSELQYPHLDMKILVCVINNWDNFEAAALIFDEKELRNMNNPADPRTQRWFSVPVPVVDKAGIYPYKAWAWEKLKKGIKIR